MRRISGLAVIVLMGGCCACSVCYAHAARPVSALAPVIDPFLPALEGKAVVTLPEFRKMLELRPAGTGGDGGEVVSLLPGTSGLVVHAFMHVVAKGLDIGQLLVTTQERDHGPPIVQKLSMTLPISPCIGAGSMIAAYGLRFPGPAPIVDPPPPPLPGVVVHASPKAPAELLPDGKMKYVRRFASGSIWANFALVPIFKPKCVWRFGMVFGKASR